MLRYWDQVWAKAVGLKYDLWGFREFCITSGFCTEPTFYRWKNGSLDMRAKTAEAIIDALDCSEIPPAQG